MGVSSFAIKAGGAYYVLYREGDNMLALEGYYDGSAIQTLQRIQAGKNQKLIITVLDEFMKEQPAGREVNLEQFMMPATERGQDADHYVRGLRDNDRF